MCGIFGFVGSVSQKQAMSCLNTLIHRGPDGYGLWSQPDVTLGHRRLSILDLSDNGKQPMSYADGRYHITFNGEIYNFLELRSELQTKGYMFQSQSDTEVILAAFIEWGEACLHKFNGMWAFAIWDSLKKSLFLSRDRFGKKPLFYTVLPNGDFAFASEMKALFPLLPEVSANRELVTDKTRIFSYENTDQCVINGIKRFPAGHHGRVNAGKLRVKRWWCTLDNLVDVPRRYEDQVEQFRTLFLDSCRLRMRSDVPIGTALSGGLDSSATISAMAYLSRSNPSERMGKSWQHAFVASFPGTPLDETEYARMVTNHIGIDATIIEIDPLKAIDNLSHYFYLFEDLYITSPIPFMLTYGAVKAHGISVTLDGHGADELFGGYPFDYIEALEDAKWSPSKSREILDTYYSCFGNDPQLNNLPSKAEFLLKWHGRRAINRIIGRGNRIISRDSGHAGFNQLDRLNKKLYVSTHETVLPTLLRNYDRYSMANSVEIRMPFMDHRVVSFAFSLPWTSKLRNGFSKAIIRDAVAPFMPPAVAYRKTKIGFNSPIIDWMKGPLKPFMLDTISSESFKKCELIDPVSVTELVRKVISNPSASFLEGENAWTKLTPYFWEQSVIKGQAV